MSRGGDHLGTIVDGKLRYVSASQIKDWKLCKRHWSFKKLSKIVAPPNTAMERGIKIHKAIEAYFKGETWDEEFTPFVELASIKLPERGPDLKVESKIEIPTWDEGPTFIGYMDLNKAGSVWDYKSTSNFVYALNEQEMREDTQMMAYAKYLFSQDPNLEYVDLCLLYLLTKTKKPKDLPVKATVTREEVENIWQRDLEIIREMAEVAETYVKQYGLPVDPDKIDALPPTLTSCDKYLGCFYKSRCGVGVVSVDALMRGSKRKMGTSLSEKLKAKAREAEGIVPPDAPPRTVTPEEPKSLAQELDLTKYKTPTPIEPPKEAPVMVNGRRQFVIYIDSIPLKGEHKQKYVLLEDWIAPVLKDLAEEHAVADFRMISYTSKAALATHLRKMIDQIPEVVVVNSYSVGSSEFLETLVPLASSVIKALK